MSVNRLTDIDNNKNHVKLIIYKNYILLQKIL